MVTTRRAFQKEAVKRKCLLKRKREEIFGMMIRMESESEWGESL